MNRKLLNEAKDRPCVLCSSIGMTVAAINAETDIKPNETAEAHAMRLRGYGNAIVAGCAIEFISAFMEYKE